MYDEFIPLSDVRDYIDHSGVYEIVCKQNGRSYIGQSTSIVQRVMQHLNALVNDRHSNKLLQHDWNRANDKGKFQFRLIAEIPYSETSELYRQERREMERRREHGIKLYNDFHLTKVPETELGIEIAIDENMRQARQQKDRAKLEYQKARQEYTRARNREYRRVVGPSPSIDYEEVTCNDCGKPGGLNLRIFRCDDKLLRCERCIDAYLGKQRGWMGATKRAERTISNRYRRWQMGSDNYAREIMLAISSYVRRFSVRPRKVLLGKGFSGDKEKLEGKVKADIEINRYTPTGYVDLPYPQSEK